MSNFTPESFATMNPQTEWENLQAKLAEYKIYVRLNAITLAMVNHYEGKHDFSKRVSNWINKNFEQELADCGILYITIKTIGNMAYLEYHFEEYSKGYKSYFLDYLKKYDDTLPTISLEIFSKHTNMSYFDEQIQKIEAITMQDVKEICESWNNSFKQLQNTHKFAAMLCSELEYRFYLNCDERYGNGKIVKDR